MAATLAATSAFGLMAAAQDAENDTVVAVVNGKQLTRGDLEASYAVLPEQYRQMPLESVYDPLLQRLVDGELLLQAAETAHLEEDKDIQAALQRARDDVLRQSYLERAIDEKVTDEKLQEAYEAKKAEPDFAKDEVKARHILLKTEDEAKEIIKELDGGADFAELAKEKSTGPSGPNGGDLGYFERGAMVPEFGEAAFAMEPGSYSKVPVETQFGWHVILVEDKRQNVPTFEETEPQLRQELASQAVGEVLEDVRKGAEVTRFNIDGSEQAPAEATDEQPAEKKAE